MAAGVMTLYGEPGWGSAIVELQLAWYGLDYEYERVGNLFKDPEARARLQAVNPLAQVPTLVLPDGTVMTESAAITLLLAEQAGSDSLVPAAGSDERAAFLRWLVFIVANIYPTYTYADDPARFVEVVDAQKPFRRSVDAYACRLYSQLEDVAATPWFLGDKFSAIDIYLAVMTEWRPNPPWFEKNAPRLSAIARATRERAELRDVWARNVLPTTPPTT